MEKRNLKTLTWVGAFVSILLHLGFLRMSFGTKQEIPILSKKKTRIPIRFATPKKKPSREKALSWQQLRGPGFNQRLPKASVFGKVSGSSNEWLYIRIQEALMGTSYPKDAEGRVEVRAFVDTKGKIQLNKVKFKSGDRRLENMVRRAFIFHNQRAYDSRHWAAKKNLSFKMTFQFYLEKNTREWGELKRFTYISEDHLSFIRVRNLKPYNYGGAINLLDLFL